MLWPSESRILQIIVDRLLFPKTSNNFTVKVLTIFLTSSFQLYITNDTMHKVADKFFLEGQKQDHEIEGKTPAYNGVISIISTRDLMLFSNLI